MYMENQTLGRREVHIGIPQRRLQTAIDRVVYQTTFFEERIDFALGYGFERYLRISNRRLGKPQKIGLDKNIRWERTTAQDKRGIHCVYSRYIAEGEYNPIWMCDYKKIGESVRLVRGALSIEIEKGGFCQTMQGLSDVEAMEREITYSSCSFMDKDGTELKPEIRTVQEAGADSLKIGFAQNGKPIDLETEVLFMYQILSRC